MTFEAALWAAVIAAPFIYVAYSNYRQARSERALDERIRESYIEGVR